MHSQANEIILLGAGASKDASLPDTRELVQSVLDYFSDPATREPFRDYMLQILNFVLGGICFQSGRLNKNPTWDINIEDIANVLELLSTRQSHYINSFISGWHTDIEKIEAHTSINNSAWWGSYSGNKKYTDNPFLNLKQRLVDYIADKLWLTDQNLPLLDYLVPLVDSAVKNKLTIATLNYDVNIELVAKRLGYSVYPLGMQFQDENTQKPKDTTLNLIKLHGSVNWLNTVEGHGSSLPRRHGIKDKKDLLNLNKDHYIHSIIFGGENKLTAKSPFLQLVSQFAIGLNNVDRVTLIGYSLQDIHVNELLRTWIASRKTKDSTYPLLRFINPDKSLLSKLSQTLDVREPYIYEVINDEDMPMIQMIYAPARDAISTLYQSP